MFEIYNEAARRVIFFARYETGEFGGAEIETEHFLLGLIRHDQGQLERLAGTPIDAEAIRQQIRDRMPLGEKIPTDVNMPLSMECRLALLSTGEEAKRLNHQHIGPEHLLLGLLLRHDCVAAEILRGLGLSVEKVREDLAKRSGGTWA